MKHYFIINPRSGKGRHAEELEAKIREVCEAEKITYECYFTKGVGDATEFVRRVCEEAEELPARFYACGGDGTLCEVVNGVGLCKDAAVGVIPVGTGNDFVKNFTVPSLFLDISAQVGGREESIDLLRCNDILAINMVNIGFDCEVVKKKEELGRKKHFPKKLTYVAGLIITLVKKPTVKLKLALEGGVEEEKHFLLTTIANGSFCGGGFNSNPRSSLNDGNIDTIFVNNVSRSKFVSLVGSYKKGTHITEKNMKVLSHGKCKSLFMRFPEKRSASIDGELYEFEELKIECLPLAGRIIIPRGVGISCAPVAERVPV
ncbi:MAG: diacylglycerol kinase family lipid kinase [Ruminococcaceae bacterium]|nr:diacylglycerol kinase family lipid kinase [Oscillospiraceae bacterium]